MTSIASPTVSSRATGFASNVVSIDELRAHCTNCGLRELCLPAGLAATEFVLWMTRDEIGSYLGLKLETVSRLFSKFHEEGLVPVQGRGIKIIDMPTLRLLVNRRA